MKIFAITFYMVDLPRKDRAIAIRTNWEASRD